MKTIILLALLVTTPCFAQEEPKEVKLQTYTSRFVKEFKDMGEMVSVSTLKGIVVMAVMFCAFPEDIARKATKAVVYQAFKVPKDVVFGVGDGLYETSINTAKYLGRH